jgi:8-oxo-dGTP diphosphatase
MTTPNAVPLTLVTAGVIRDEQGRILLARRPAGRHMGGLWEFPGGKVADGEDPSAALARELEEELGFEARVGPPITFALHQEHGLRILLLFYATRIGQGSPRPLEGQELAWVLPAELDRYPTPPADAVLVRQLAAAAAHRNEYGGTS